jgi:hypothetical protein
MKLLTLVFVLAFAAFVHADGDIDRIVLNAAASLADERLESVLKTLEALAGTSDVQSADWERMKSVLQRYQENTADGAVWFALPNGAYYTAGKGLQEQTLADRAYFPKLLDGERAVGDIVTSRSTGRHVVIAAVPVKLGGSVIGALGVSMYLDKLSEEITECLGLPSDMAFVAVTEGGLVALHRDASRLGSPAGDLGQAVSITSSLTGWRFVSPEQ